MSRSVFTRRWLHLSTAIVVAAVLGPQAMALTGVSQTINFNNSLNVGGAPLSSTPGSGVFLDGNNGPSADAGGSQILSNLSSNAVGVNGNVNYTAAAWVNWSDLNGDNMVFGQPGTSAALHLGARGNQVHYGHWGNDSNSGATTLNTGQWYHVAWEYQNGNQKIYLDGNLVATNALGALNSGDNLSIGRSRNNGAFNGTLDDVVIYPTALSDAQIQSLATGVDPTLVDTPTLFYNLEETSGTVVGNQGTTGTAGTFVNSQTVVISPPAGAAANWRIRGMNVIPGGGEDDSDLNSAGEALNIWQNLDQNPATGIRPIGGRTYNIQNNVTDTTDVVDFISATTGGGGSFGVNYDPRLVGGVLDFGVDDYSLRATAKTELAPGIYTIAIGSDDGRYLKLAGAEILAVNGQAGTQQISPDSIMFHQPTGHDQSLVTFQTTGKLTIDGLFYERGGGDSIEISIADGMRTSFNTTDFQLLQPGALGGNVLAMTPSDPPPGPKVSQDGRVHGLTPGFNVKAFGNQGNLSSTSQVLGIWQTLDAAGTGFVTTTANEIDYAGGGGDFTVNNPYPAGAGIGGDQFSVRAQAFVGIPVGTWTIAAASDDGRILALGLPGMAPFDAVGDQQNFSGVDPVTGLTFVGYENPTGHARSVATFTIEPGEANMGDYYATILDSFFWEAGGGDSFEISIAPGALADFGALGGGNFRLLENGTFGWIVSQTAFQAVPEPMTGLLSLLGLGALALRRRRTA